MTTSLLPMCIAIWLWLGTASCSCATRKFQAVFKPVYLSRMQSQNQPLCQPRRPINPWPCSSGNARWSPSEMLVENIPFVTLLDRISSNDNGGELPSQEIWGRRFQRLHAQATHSKTMFGQARTMQVPTVVSERTGYLIALLCIRTWVSSNTSRTRSGLAFSRCTCVVAEQIGYANITSILYPL